ncbi:MAG: AMP-binding protein [Solirubrobacteraceae bacterium]|jgi:O-succinylbenzoic acid--CoA ligase
MNPHWLALAASMHPERPAIIAGGEALGYAQLHERARSVSAALKARGVRTGDRVALALPAGAELVAALHGCWYAGAVAVPIDLRLTAAERAQRASGAALTVDGALAGERMHDATALPPTRERMHDATALPPTGERPDRAHPPAAPTAGFEPDAVAAVLHTSGTTAAPRPVALTFGNFLWSALGSAVALGLDQRERWLCPMPLVHVGGLSIPIRSAIYATTAILHERFDTGAVCATLMDPEQRITLVSLVPTMLARLLDAGLRAPPTLRWALLGGGPIGDGLLARAHEASVPVAPTYGMTEACSQIATNGFPLTGVQLRIEGGELLVRGPIVAPGALAPDGWLHTGDLGSFEQRSGLVISGRQSDTIITGGENVAPAEVEAVLLEHAAIADAGVHARPDPEWGEAVVATVVLRGGASAGPSELRAFCAARLAPYKVPKAVVFAPALPRTESGKLLRRKLS